MRHSLIQMSLRQRLTGRLRSQRSVQQHQQRANSSSQPKELDSTSFAKAPRKPASSTNGAAAGSAQSSANGAAPVPIWMRLGPLTTIATAFGRAQKKRPYVVQFASALVIFSCADVSAQNIGDAEYDPVRTARTMVIGSIFAIPQYHWFHVLARLFNYKSRVLSIAAKVLFGQFTFAIAFPTYFFGMQALLSGENLARTVQRLKDTVPLSWQNSWKVWPAAMAFNLTYVPLEYRALFSGLIAIGWQTYLSWMNRQAELKEKATQDAAQENKVLVAPVQAAVAA